MVATPTPSLESAPQPVGGSPAAGPGHAPMAAPAAYAATRAGLIDLATAGRAACLLSAGVESGLFARLAEGPVSLSRLADAVRLPAPAVRALLGGLGALGLVRRCEGLFAAPADFAALLGPGPQSVAPEMRLHRREHAVWLRAAAILAGREAPPDAYRLELMQSRLGRYRGILAMNRALGADIAERLAPVLAGPARVLDVGGGDGVLARVLLDRFPDLEVEILDLEDGLEMCRGERARLASGRLRLTVGDARRVARPGRYDLVLVNELLELFPAAEKRAILENAAAALAPGGRLAVVKFTLSDDALQPPGAALFAFRMAMKNPGAYLETDAEAAEMLRACGCAPVAVHDLAGIKSILVAGRDPASGPVASSPHERESEPVTSSPDRSEAQIALWRDLVSVATSFRPAAILFAAVELDLFSKTPAAGCDAAEAARLIGVPETGARVLMNALAAIGLLVKTGERFTAPDDVRALLGDGPHAITHEVLAYRRENEIWLDLAAMLRDPAARPEDAEIMQGERLPGYLTAVALSNLPAIERLAERFGPRLPDGARALDLGGGGGAFSTRLLARAPSVQVTLFDRPDVIERNRDLLAGPVADGRLSLVAGDALAFDLPPDFDLVLMSDLLHYFAPADKRRVLRNAAAALAPGGLLAVAKFTLGETGIEPPAAALFSLRLHVQEPDAFLETDEELATMLAEIGLEAVERESLGPAKTLATARKPR
ncbi:MAG: class I SAM-dependent methyltransferase [Alphaproteobacteria bacterium]|nr:class I SAM-dependent methyltransferase [Alphaproteobacteria bacterium]